ncbi:MAG: hypothetical protein ABIE03_03155 [Patescibacteria group bacterium]|nr:hypothetical protein [Patescibacteria group bacterium]
MIYEYNKFVNSLLDTAGHVLFVVVSTIFDTETLSRMCLKRGNLVLTLDEGMPVLESAFWAIPAEKRPTLPIELSGLIGT